MTAKLPTPQSDATSRNYRMVAQRRRLNLNAQETYSLAEIYSSGKSSAAAIAVKSVAGFKAAGAEGLS